MDAKWIGCAPGNFRQGRPGGYRPEAIVIHIMDGPMSAADSWFNDPRAKVSAHYGVGKDGTLHQYVKEVDTAFHAGTIVAPTWNLLKAGVNPNFYTIGIEHEGRGDVPWPWPDLQLNASVALVREIAARWNIDLAKNTIVMHHQIRANKTCPGVHFNLANYRELLNAAPGPAVAIADTTSLTAAPVNLRALMNANLRRYPQTDAAIAGVLAVGDTFAATETTRSGEEVHGNPVWYKNAGGEYLWAGATDKPRGV